MKTLFLTLFLALSFFIPTGFAALSEAELKEVYSKKDSLGLQTSDLGDIVTRVQHIYSYARDNASKDKDSEFKGRTPKDLHTPFRSIIHSKYQEGKITLSQVELFDKKYQALIDSYPTRRNILEKKAATYLLDPLLKEYVKIFTAVVKDATVNPPKCVQVGGNATAGVCCQGLYKSSALEPIVQGQCSEAAKSCDKDSECCSGVCSKDEGADKPGVCLPQLSCYAVHNLGDTCSETSPFCAQGDCESINKATAGIGECLPEAKSCNSNSECCSNTCSNGQCVKKMQCSSCIKGGHKPKPGEKCCDGYYKNRNGKCIIDMPPLIPLQTKVESGLKKILISAVNIIIPSAHAEDKPSDKAEEKKKPKLTSAQQTMIDQKLADCKKKTGNSAEYNKCAEGVEHLKTNFLRDKKTPLTKDQRKQLEKARKACVQNNASGSKELSKCMAKAKSQEDTFKQQNEKLGVKGSSYSAEDYLKEYAIPGVTAKTFSNPKQCEFNSFNDNWRSASNQEKNAEIFLRAFEFVYSGDGAQDFWVDNGKGNIYSRANKAAKHFRKNRYLLTKRLQEIDKEMTCRCVAIFGAAKFSAEKQEFFNNNCAAERAKLRKELGGDLDEKYDESKVDGTSLSGNDKDEKDRGEIEETDKGAVGISYEKLLIEWLKLRREAQAVRFVDNSKLETDLDGLSEYIDEVQWNIAEEGDHTSNPWRGDVEKLYNYTVKYFDFGILGALVGGIIAFATFGFGLIIIVGIAAGFGAQELLTGFLGGASGSKAKGLIAVLWTSFTTIMWPTPALTPHIDDDRTKRWCATKIKSFCILRKDTYARYFEGPRFVSKATGPNKCDIKASSAACIRTGYKTKFNDKVHFILDGTRPLFVPYGEISTLKMHGKNQDYVQMINTARNQGVNFLKSTGPGTTGTGFMKRNIMREAISKGYFLPERGKLDPVDFDKAKLPKRIKTAAAKYAMTTNLRDAGASDELASETDIGFGFLFESPEEAKEFADYAYIHYQMSSLSPEARFGYPKASQTAYFRLVAYNMKLVGSLAVTHILNLSEAVNLYTNDLEKRVRDYNALGTASIGEASKNISLSDPVYGVFATLDFNGKASLESFNTAMLTAQKAKKFSAAESKFLSAAKNKALALNKDIAKKEQYEKATKGKKGSNYRKSSINKGIANINNPLDSFSMKKMGDTSSKSFGGSALTNNSDSPSDKLVKDIKEKSVELNKLPSIDFKIPKANPKSVAAYKARGTYTKPANQEMSYSEAEQLIENINKDKTLIEPYESDSLFQIVTKAYKRNYSRVLRRSRDFVDQKEDIEDKKEELSDENKKELKLLLESGAN